MILIIIIKKEIKKVLIVFDDMIADIMSSKKFKAINKDLFIFLKFKVEKNYKTLHKKIQETSILKIF